MLQSCADALQEERDLAGKMLLKFAAASADVCCSDPSENGTEWSLFGMVWSGASGVLPFLVCLLVADTAMERHETTARDNR